MSSATHLAIEHLGAQRHAGLRVSEVFGSTWQGEGPHAGRVVGFLRLGLCNLGCSWCDSAWTWDRTRYDVDAECPLTPVPEVVDRVRALGVDTVVISGGEPLLHQGVLPQLMDALPDLHWHVETNGTITPTPGMVERVSHWSVSPKLSNNGADPEKKRIRPKTLRVFVDETTAIFKFVVTRPEDVDEVRQLTAEHVIPRDRVWIMPEGTTAAQVIKTHRQVADAAIAAGLNTTTRLHILLYDDLRGV
jgi:7-carboxy-7-deazaguanine synthase